MQRLLIAVFFIVFLSRGFAAYDSNQVLIIGKIRNFSPQAVEIVSNKDTKIVPMKLFPKDFRPVFGKKVVLAINITQIREITIKQSRKKRSRGSRR